MIHSYITEYRNVLSIDQPEKWADIMGGKFMIACGVNQDPHGFVRELGGSIFVNYFKYFSETISSIN